MAYYNLYVVYYALLSLLTVFAEAFEDCKPQHGVPYFIDQEGRCAECSSEVCHTVDPLPSRCHRYCAENWLTETHSNPTTPSPEGNSLITDSDVGNTAIVWAWRGIVSVLLVVLVMKATCGRKIRKLCIRSKTPSRPIVRNPTVEENTGTINLLEQHPASLPITAARQAVTYKSPTPVSEQYKEDSLTEETLVKGTADSSQDSLRRVHSQAQSSGRDVGAPGHKYELLTESNV